MINIETPVEFRVGSLEICEGIVATATFAAVFTVGSRDNTPLEIVLKHDVGMMFPPNCAPGATGHPAGGVQPEDGAKSWVAGDWASSALKSPPNSAALGTLNVLVIAELNLYQSALKKKNVLFRPS